MKRLSILAATLSPLALLASCGNATTGDGAQAQSTPSPTSGTSGEVDDFAISEHGTFDEPWAAAFVPGTNYLFVTERGGTAKLVDIASNRVRTVTGLPKVDYGGQGGLGDVTFLASESGATLGSRTIYLSWAEAGTGDTRGAAVGRGTLVCGEADACRIDRLSVIWRQDPKVTGRGHYSHRLAISPDGQHLFVASGDRQKMQPAQDLSSHLGKIVRLSLDGSPASDSPLASRPGAKPGIWSMGHRNILGLAFDSQGRLWDLEHGPAGGDELNLVEPGANYGWPEVSDGDHYNGDPIPRHSTSSEFAKPAISWNPVIAPGDFIFYGGNQFTGWQGQAIIATMKPTGIVRVAIDGSAAREVARYETDERIREIVEGPDGAIWVLEDGDGGRLLRLTPQ